MTKLCIAFMLLYCTAASAQPYWFWQNPQPQGNSLTGINIFSSAAAIVVGASSTVMMSFDAGQTWKVKSSVAGTSSLLMSAHFIDDSEGWAVGYGGVVIHTTDGGNNWVKYREAADEQLTTVFFLDENTGWITGSKNPPGTEVILKTTDAGASWRTLSSGLSTSYAEAIAFVNATTGWLIVWNAILKTTTGGTSWSTQASGVGVCYAMSFTDENHGWVSGESGKIFATTDGGAHWNSQVSGSGAYLFDIAFTDTLHGWAVGESGTIVATSDGGATWFSQASGVSTRLNGVKFFDENIGWASGSGGMILHTTDGGAHWMQSSMGTTYSISDMVARANGSGVAVGGDFDASGYPRGIIMKTTDGGLGWNPAAYPPVLFHAVTFSDSVNGWACGDYGNILHTTDGASTWESQESGTNLPLLDIQALHRDTAIAMGGIPYDRASQRRAQASKIPLDQPQDQSIFVRTTDGGQHWNPVSISTDASLQSASFVNGRIGWMAGVHYNTGPGDADRGLVFKTTDGGMTWTMQLNVSNMQLFYAVTFVDTNTGWAAGGDYGFPGTGFIMKTIDGGETWSTQASGLSQSVRGLDFLDRQYGYAVLRDGRILNTRNGGSTWHDEPSPTSNSLRSVVVIDTETAYACGDGGTILRSFPELPPEPPGPPALVFPPPDSTLNSTLVRFDWDRSQGAEHFRLEVSPDSTFTGAAVESDSNIVKTFRTLQLPEDPVARYYWRVRAENKDGASAWTAVRGFIAESPTGVSARPAIPAEYVLHQNYPDPFNPSTIISYEIPHRGFVTLKVFNALGQEVSTLVDSWREAGAYRNEFHRSDLASGVYLYRLTVTGDDGRMSYSSARSMVLLR